MFGFGKKNKMQQNDLVIFSAEQAKQMVIDANLQKRNDNRAVIFSGIKAVIKTGGNEYLAPRYLFENGNDTYFEGLGYKMKSLWYDSWSGQYSETEPENVSDNPVESSQDTGTAIINGFNWNSGMNIGMSRRQSSYQPYIKLSWE